MAVAGFRVLEFLAWGRALYVDDLSTLPDHRGAGHGRALMDRLAVLASDAARPHSTKSAANPGMPGSATHST